MSKVRLEDAELGKVLYLHSEKADAEALAAVLARGHLQRFEVLEHTSQLGWYVKDRESGRMYDAQGLI